MNSNHDPIERLSSKLRNHRVPYRPGAWEEFKTQAGKQKKSLRLWPYFSAAAVLLIGLLVFLWTGYQGQPEAVNPYAAARLPEAAEQKAPEASPPAGSSGSIRAEAHEQAGTDDLSSGTTAVKEPVFAISGTPPAGQSSGQERRKIAQQPRQPEVALARAAQLPQGRRLQALESAARPLSVPLYEVQGPRTPETTQAGDFLAALLEAEKKENQQAHSFSEHPASKWAFGVDIAPNISSNRQVNMGGGFAVAYAISDKLSLSSGISYLQLDAERGASSSRPVDMLSSPATGYVPINVQDKTLKKFQANLAGVDIPLNLNYHLNDRLFTSVGVSFFNVVRERGMNQYLIQQAEMSYQSNAADAPSPVVRTFASKEAAQEKRYEGKNMSSFFNFSVGYKLPVSKRTSLGIEPFLKVPIGYIAPDELNLSNGGLKISTRF